MLRWVVAGVLAGYAFAPPPGGAVWLSWLAGVAAVSEVFELVLREYARRGQEERERQVHRSVRESQLPNPFLNHTPVNYYRLRYLWPGIFLIPIRMLIALGTVISASLCGVVAKAIIGEKALKEPLKSPFHKLLQGIVRLHTRVLLFSFGFVWIKRIGRIAPKTEAGIVVANHRGLFEALYLLSNDCCMLSARSNRFPVLCHAMDVLQFMWVSRSDPDSRAKTVEMIAERSDLSRGWSQVMLFPEGTTTNGRALVQFRRGAFNPGVPVQPVAFKFPNDELDVDPSWVFGVHGAMSGIFTIMIRLMASWYNPLTVTFLKVHVPSAEEKKDSLLFANNVRKEIANALEIPTTEHSQADVALMVEAVKLRLPPGEVDDSFNKIKDLHHLDGKQARDMLKRFARVADRTGHVSYDNFAKILNLPKGPGMQSLFKMLKTDDTGKVDFGHWLAGVTSFSSNIEGNEASKLLFELVDIDQSGCLSQQEMFALMRLGCRSDESREQTQMHLDRIWAEMLRYEEKGANKVSKEAFMQFLTENDGYAMYFKQLSTEAKAGTEGNLPLDRHQSFLNWQSVLKRQDGAAAD